MSTTVCLVPAPTIGYPRGGGQLLGVLELDPGPARYRMPSDLAGGVVTHWWGGTFEAGESRRRLVSDGD